MIFTDIQNLKHVLVLIENVLARIDMLSESFVSTSNYGYAARFSF